MSECVRVSVCVRKKEEAGGGGRSGAALKTKTPHVNVGKKHHDSLDRHARDTSRKSYLHRHGACAITPPLSVVSCCTPKHCWLVIPLLESKAIAFGSAQQITAAKQHMDSA